MQDEQEQTLATFAPKFGWPTTPRLFAVLAIILTVFGSASTEVHIWHVMALRSNGQLLVKVRGQPFSTIFGAAKPVAIHGYAIEPLSPAPQARPTFNASVPGDHWLLAKPARSMSDPNPWDSAHAAAKASGYKHYFEPDLVHPAPPPGTLVGGLNKNWPPFPPHDDVSPGWHLETGFTGFSDVRAIATGAGVRIAHLDTGYTPNHASKPRNLRPDLGYDYWDHKCDPVDPGTNGNPFLMPGHGTATLALLAGNTVDLPFRTHRFQGDIGGAPDAEVIPVRISPSVIHLYTSTMAQGLYHALAPKGDYKNRCDVVSISHGGLPTSCWADAVNVLYEDGITVVAASGDSIFAEFVDIATHYTVYPSAFNRVLTAVGATYLKRPYITNKPGVIQGCWGPDTVMEKAIAGYTPNVAWMVFNVLPCGFEMSGGGTSSSTPQIAAACALWLQLYCKPLPVDWRRVEACRLALFDTADNKRPNKPKLGWGMLNVKKCWTLASQLI
jgi:hypothetical protein